MGNTLSPILNINSTTQQNAKTQSRQARPGHEIHLPLQSDPQAASLAEGLPAAVHPKRHLPPLTSPEAEEAEQDLLPREGHQLPVNGHPHQQIPGAEDLATEVQARPCQEAHRSREVHGQEKTQVLPHPSDKGEVSGVPGCAQGSR